MNPSKPIKSLLLTAVAVLAACSNIPEDERLIYVAPAVAERNVLIEDFTGQRCVNCPNATIAIHGLMELYGDNIIPVAIHSGPLGYTGSRTQIGLVTEAGTEYWNSHFDNSQGQPVAVFSRSVIGQGASTSEAILASWSKYTNDILGQTTEVSIEVATKYNPETRTVEISSSVLAPAGRKAKYQLWLVEDGIVAMQTVPDEETKGSKNDREYVHNHVLRDAINGTWGEEITFAEAPLQLRHTYTLPAAFGSDGTLASDCVPENCHIVAFVYTDKGVDQVVKAKVTD